MPVQKFRDFDTARRALWLPSGHKDIAGRIKSLWTFSHRLAWHEIPRGVHKFRSIEEANRARQRWGIQNSWRRGSESGQTTAAGK